MQKLSPKQKKALIYIITVSLSILYIIIGSKVTSDNLMIFSGNENEAAVRACVTSVIEKIETEYELSETDTQTGWELYFSAEMTSGGHKGDIIDAVQVEDPFFASDSKEVEPGDKVLLAKVENDEYPVSRIFIDYERFNPMIILTIVFLLGLLVFGRTKGFNTILSLVFTCLSVFVVFIPAVLTGKNIYFWSILTCIYIILMTLLLVCGANPKSLAAGIGCFAGTMVASLTTSIMDKFIKLTGMLNDESMYLQMLNPDNPINLKAIIFAAIIIGAIGAIMDVSMSISSALYELRETARSIRPIELFRSGLRIGRDIMGTMANTLILAYIGSSLSLVLLLVSYQSSLIELLNRELIIVEILQALAGSLGILLTIPLTSAVCSVLFFRKKEASYSSHSS